MTASAADTPRDRSVQDDLLPHLRRLLAHVAEVVDIRPLSDEERAHVRGLEDQAQESGAVGGLMAFVNEGIDQALASDAVYAVLTGPMVDDPPAPWTIMLDDEDKVIGEWLPASRIEEARQSGHCIFLSDDFVMYKNRRPKGKSRFVMPYICLPLEEDDARFTVCGVGSPSTPGDEYIRSLMGNPGKDVATLVLGVCFKKEDG